MNKITITLILSLTCIVAQAQPFAQVGASLAGSKGAVVQSVSVDIGYRLDAVDLSVGLAESRLTAGSYSKRYMSKTVSAAGYAPLFGAVSAFAGVQGSTDHTDVFSWRYGVGLIGHVKGLTTSFTVSPAQGSKASLVGLSVKKRF